MQFILINQESKKQERNMMKTDMMFQMRICNDQHLVESSILVFMNHKLQCYDYTLFQLTVNPELLIFSFPMLTLLDYYA